MELAFTLGFILGMVTLGVLILVNDCLRRRERKREEIPPPPVFWSV